ncbi:MAG: OmpA family protein [Myxococcales bacterium]|nr:OmpA family protein [Myxococcales bacterium]
MNKKLSVFAALALVLGGVYATGCTVKASAGPTTPAPTPSAEPTPPPPPKDTDGDGVADADDACPDKAGKASADKAKNGCPDAPLVEVKGNYVEIHQQVLFESGKATIQDSSNKLLDEIAKVINEVTAIELVEVAGHADKQGDDKVNVKLTDDRAKAVVAALVKRGVDPKKLRAKGYGEYCPIDTADTPEAHEKNRRVEFDIVKIGGKKTDVKLGCDEATKKGVKPAPVP